MDEEKITSGVRTTSGTTDDIKIDAELSSVIIDQPSAVGLFHASFAVGGLTCSSCVAKITHVLNQISWVRAADINLLSNSASVTFEGKEHLGEIVEAIEDVGYDATLG